MRPEHVDPQGDPGRASVAWRAALADRAVRIALALAVLWTAGYALATGLTLGHPAALKAVANVAYLLPLVGATTLAVLAARRRHGRARGFWSLLAVSNGLWVVGELTWSTYELVLHRDPPFPSLADAFYLSSYVVVVPAVLVAFGGASGLRKLRGLLDASIMVVALGVAGYVLLIGPQLEGGMSWATATGIAYPLLGVVILMVLLAVGFSGHESTPPSVVLVALAFAVTAVTDLLYTYTAVLHDFVNGSWLNVAWQFEACLLCVAAFMAWRRDEGAAEVLVRQRDRGLPLVLAGVAATLALVAFDAAAVVAGGYAVLALLVRLGLTARDKEVIAERLEHSLHEQQRLAVTDPLTGLHNRRFFEEMLALEGARARRGDAPLGLVVVDLDHFKRINDTHGHPGGDAVLQTAAQRLAGAVRAGDVLARYGGEEFVVLLPTASAEETQTVAERCRVAVGGAPIFLPGAAVAVTASVGFAVAPDHASETEELVRRADTALYVAKRLGRNQVRSAAMPDGEALDALGSDNQVVDYLQLLADEIDSRQAGQSHSLAMSRWARRLAAELGLDEEATWRAVAGARLHDIGKVAVPDAILAKPGALTQAEWAVVREHPEQGARLVALDPILAGLRSAVLQHHERPDGLGYPRGMRGGAIGIEARIIAVCDAWAAMRAHRSYRPPLDREAARRQLQEGAGGQFDPRVVAAFLALEADGLVGSLQDAATAVG